MRLMENGSLVDEDDEVADVLEDKDTVSVCISLHDKGWL